MADETSLINSGLLSSLNTGAQVSGPKKTDGNDQVGKDEFLQLLVTQLKNQDPLDPMKNDQFAVDLAQFSQLEQLMQINDKLESDTGSSGSADLTSMVSYLGHEITLNSTNVEVTNGSAGRARFELVSDAPKVEVQLLDESGAVVATKDLGMLKAGKHSADLSGLEAPNGQYDLKVLVTGYSGNAAPIEGYAAGIVSGFIPGDDPSLMIGNREVKLSEIRQVNLAG